MATTVSLSGGARSAADGGAVNVRMVDTLGAIALGLLTLGLVAVLLQAEKTHRALAAELAARPSHAS